MFLIHSQRLWGTINNPLLFMVEEWELLFLTRWRESSLAKRAFLRLVYRYKTMVFAKTYSRSHGVATKQTCTHWLGLFPQIPQVHFWPWLPKLTLFPSACSILPWCWSPTWSLCRRLRRMDGRKQAQDFHVQCVFWIGLLHPALLLCKLSLKSCMYLGNVNVSPPLPYRSLGIVEVDQSGVLMLFLSVISLLCAYHRML